MHLAFVIPVLNGERFIGLCLEHLKRESLESDQIVVVDNGSRDRTVEIVRNTPGTKLIEAPGVTVAALRNRGAALSTNDVLAFVDADCLICPGWRASVERVLSDPSVAAAGSYYDVPEGATWVERAWWSFRPKHEQRTTFLISGNFVVRREAFSLVGGFDERFVTDEDTDMSRRLIAAGATLVEAPSVRVLHLGNAKTLRQFAMKEKWHATSIVAAMDLRHLDGPTMLTLVFIVTCTLAAGGVLLALAGYGAAFALLSLLLVAPGANAAYKVVTCGNYRYFLELLVLYLIVYVVRTLVVGSHFLHRGRPDSSPR